MPPLIIRTTGVEEFLDAAGETHIKALIMGESSAGKSRSAAFWPAPIYADCEGGLMSVADREVPYAAIRSSADMDALLKMLEVECATKSPAQRRYKTLVLDTLDSYQRIVVQEILKAGRKEALSGYQDWGQLDSKMTSLVARLHALSMNIVVNLHIKSAKDGGDDGPLIMVPKLKGDIRDQISCEFDLVGHMATYWASENGERVLKRAIKWHPEPGFPILKDRSGQLPQFTEVTFTDADYAGLFERMFGEYLDTLAASKDVEEITTDEAVDEPHAGGPVAVAQPGGKPPVKPAEPATSEATPEARARARKAAVPPAKKAAVPPPRAAVSPTPDPAPEPAQQEAQPVTAEPAPAEPAPAEPAAEAKAVPVPEFTEPRAAAQAAVAEHLGGKVVAEETAPPEPPTKPGKPPVPCGTPAKNNKGEAAAGCGLDVNEVGNPDLVNIGLIKTRTYLCPTCLKTWRDTHK